MSVPTPCARCTPSRTAVLLFTDDLRLDDNPLLHAACKHQQLLCLFVFDEILMREQHGMRATGPLRAHFLWQSLQDLGHQLGHWGHPLHIVTGNLQEVLTDIEQQLGEFTLYLQSPVGWYERRRLARLQAAFDVRTINSRTLLSELDLGMDIGQLPRQFTAFRQQLERQWPHIHALPKPAQLPPPVRISLPLLTACPLPLFSVSDQRRAIQLDGGESKAGERLIHYIWQSKALGHYKQTRNGLLGPNYSSKFSPWLANGCVSARRIYQQVRAFEATFGANDSTYWLIFELLWRDFFHFCALRDGPALFAAPKLSARSLPKQDQHHSFERWRLGQTGDTFVDANMRELLHTGFMSNRGRQNAASFLIHDLGLDWRQGAAWFEHQLLDYDVASNYGNWAYIAGVGMDPRGGRRFNPQKQASQYDPDGAYVRHWLTS